MSDAEKPKPGTILWHDLTVDDAEGVRDFYAEVVGWRPSPVPMKGYDDFTMSTAGGDGVAGVCHAPGPNPQIPPHWMIYVIVDDVEKSAARCRELGGSVLVGPRGMGSHGHYCIIRDPAGAVLALFTPAG
jgi:predicted enzyme related to lactoylglutathione lyase